MTWLTTELEEGTARLCFLTDRYATREVAAIVDCDIQEPGERVWPEMMCWDFAVGLIVEEPMVRFWGSIFESGERREV